MTASIPAVVHCSSKGQVVALRMIADERAAQDEKFPDQHLPDVKWLAILAEEVGEAIEEGDARELVWNTLLARSFGRAAHDVTDYLFAAEPDVEQQKRLYEEIIQTAAVCVRWAEDIRLRHGWDL